MDFAAGRISCEHRLDRTRRARDARVEAAEAKKAKAAEKKQVQADKKVGWTMPRTPRRVR